MRKTGEELEAIKKEYNKDTLYSWSRYNLIKTDLYCYFLRYVKRVKEDRRDSIYGAVGNVVHDLLERHYLGKIEHEQMLEEYDEKVFEFEIGGLKFDRTDDCKNEKIGNKYHACNRHFLANFIPIKGKNIQLEEFLLIEVSKFLFQGYSDMCHEEVRNGKNKLIITDFKTSTIYKGAKVEKESGQLLLYSLAKIQQGWDVEDIVARWLFTKYITVTHPLKNGKFKSRDIDRHEIGKCLKSTISMWLKTDPLYTSDEVEEYLEKLIKSQDVSCLPNDIAEELGEVELIQSGDIKKSYTNKVAKLLSECPKHNDFVIEEMLNKVVAENSLQSLPESVKKLFVFEDCFVEIPINKEKIKELQIDIVKTLVDVHNKEIKYQKTKDENIYWSEITKDNEYFHAVLSGYSPNLHKPYKEYLDNENMFKTENAEEEEEEEDDLSWLAELGL